MVQKPIEKYQAEYQDESIGLPPRTLEDCLLMEKINMMGHLFTPSQYLLTLLWKGSLQWMVQE